MDFAFDEVMEDENGEFVDIHADVPVFSSEQYVRQDTEESLENADEEVQDNISGEKQNNVLDANLIGDLLGVDGLCVTVNNLAEKFFLQKTKNETELFLNQKYLKNEIITTEMIENYNKIINTEFQNLKIELKIQEAKLACMKTGFLYLKQQSDDIKQLSKNIEETINSNQNEYTLCKHKDQYEEVKRIDVNHLLEIEKINKESEELNRSIALNEQKCLSEIRSLEQKLVELTKEYEEKEKSCSETEHRVTSIKSNNADTKKKINKLTLTINDRRNNINSLNLELKEGNLKIEDMSKNEKNEILKIKINGFEKSHICYLNEVSIISKRIESGRSIIDDKARKNETLQREINDLKASLKQSEKVLEDIDKNKLEIIKKYTEMKNEHLEKKYLLQLDLHKSKQNCELNKQMLKVKEEVKLGKLNQISNLSLKLQEKKEINKKQADMMKSKMAAIENLKSEIESCNKEINNIQREIENLTKLDTNLEANKLLQVKITQEKAKELEESIRVSKNTIFSENKIKMDNLTEKEQSNKTKFINERENLISESVKINDIHDKAQVELKKQQDRLNKSKTFLIELMEEIDAMQETTKSPKIESNVLFKSTKPSQGAKILEDLLKDSVKDLEKDKETQYTPFRKRQKRFEPPERDT